MIRREHKDSLFRKLFGDESRKGCALEVYNALNGTDYQDPDVLEMTTIEDAVYIGVKNDVSFMIGSELQLWEHQSTANSNMPLRGLVYFGKLYSKLAEKFDWNIYGSKLLEIPAPRFFVFYTGDRNRPEREELRLSNSYGGRAGDVEVTATVLNVNKGHNGALLKASATLGGYAELLDRIRTNSATMPVEESVDAAVLSCIREGVLADFLRAHRAEVVDMFLTEYDKERHMRHVRAEGFEEARERGRSSIERRMREMGMDDDVLRKVLAAYDEDVRSDAGAGAAELPLAAHDRG